jgi:arylsulfatase A-like enzyme
MVIFCSDNGPHQEGNHVMEFFNSNREYRGMKRDFYDGGVRTPFIARWPGVISAGSSSGQVFAFWDFLPTFADLVNVEKPVDTDGISFLPTLLGKQQDEEHDFLYWEFFELGGKQAILKDNWKAIKLNVRGPEENVVFELYDLENDPEEATNVADQYPEMVKEFENLFHSARKEFEVTPLFSKDEKEVETPF